MVYGNDGYVGKHLIVDLIGCQGNVGRLEDVLTRLCQETGANIVAGPQFYDFRKTRTGVVVISTSHLRLVRSADNYHFDLFTCGNEANPDKISPRKTQARQYWEETFRPKEIVTYDENPRKRNISTQRRMLGQEQDLDLEELASVRSNHLFLDCAGADPKILDDPERLNMLLGMLCPKNGSAPSYLSHKFSPQGYTSVVVGSAGSASVHTWPEHGYAALDLFRYDGRPIDIKEALSQINADIGSPINMIAIEPEDRKCQPIPELVGAR